VGGIVIRAAGILILSPDDHVLLLHRVDGQGWAFPGGGIEDGESAEGAARRELLEETGHDFKGSLALWTRRIQTDPTPIDAPVGAEANAVDFTTFLAKGPEFEPKLNDEHDAYQWVDRNFALGSGQLHPGCYVSLRRFDMHEMDVAKAIVSGELTSPQRYRNLLLIAIRITGTGAAYRPTGDEFVWRDPSIYMNEDFRQRCNGLFVILEHPPDKPMLNTREFRKRIVGAICLPYLKPDANEVWGIAKVADMDIAEVLENTPTSTSPGVLFLKSELTNTVEMKDGSTLLIEGEPCLLDHVALLIPDEDGSGGLGVWDKLGPLSGVDSIDSRADSMAIQVESMLQTVKVNELYRRVSRL
jgi:8-oxo-dGTP pyrophosphatase MutT (NUDIX family)